MSTLIPSSLGPHPNVFDMCSLNVRVCGRCCSLSSSLHSNRICSWALGMTKWLNFGQLDMRKNDVCNFLDCTFTGQKCVLPFPFPTSHWLGCDCGGRRLSSHNKSHESMVQRKNGRSSLGSWRCWTSICLWSAYLSFYRKKKKKLSSVIHYYFGCSCYSHWSNFLNKYNTFAKYVGTWNMSACVSNFK